MYATCVNANANTPGDTRHPTSQEDNMARTTRTTITIPTTKVCRATGITGRINQDDPADNDFYRDKSQKDGFSPWSKAAEREYNKAYRAGLKVAKAPRVRNIDNEDALNAYNTEHDLAGTRVVRGKGRVAPVKVQAKRTSKAKATTQARKVARASKVTTPKAPRTKVAKS